ncbi:MAG: hypothetical protein ABR961_09610 [Thermoanaerobaculaceae bacterium]
MTRKVVSVNVRWAFAATMAITAFAGTCVAAAPQYFGFSWVHNPSAVSTPYSFTNIDVRPVYVSDPATKASGESQFLYESYGVCSILGFNDFLFGEDNTTAVPRSDAIQLFDAWWDGGVNHSTIRPPWVVAIWPADEALLRCNGAQDISGCLQPYLDFVSHIRDRVAGTGVLLVDSFDPITVSSGLFTQEADNLVNIGIRWFGYHQYWVLHPLTDATYEANVQRVRQIADQFRRQGYDTRFALVGDAFHDSAHTKVVGGTVLPWDWSDHRTVVDEDFQVACLNNAVALILFNWPDFPGSGEENALGSVSFQDPAACWEACLGRFVKFGETTCSLCGGVPMPVGCRGSLVRRHLIRL